MLGLQPRRIAACCRLQLNSKHLLKGIQQAVPVLSQQLLRLQAGRQLRRLLSHSCRRCSCCCAASNRPLLLLLLLAQRCRHRRQLAGRRGRRHWCKPSGQGICPTVLREAPLLCCSCFQQALHAGQRPVRNAARDKCP